MTSRPVVSVVMGVFNGEEKVRASVQSILSQEGVDLEFIIVDDGSTDNTPRILEELESRDRRIRVIRQPNQGLTIALIRGCSEAKGELIARQDCGDLSLPGRLRAQVGVMKSHPDAALVSTGTRFVGPAGELLYEIIMGDQSAAVDSIGTRLDQFRGPSCHPCTLFPRDLYQMVGGYRSEFYFAQDLDLWSRLIEHGNHLEISYVMYEANFSPTGISAVYRARQIELRQVIFECTRLRRSGVSEENELLKARKVSPATAPLSPSERASALYFIGACLHNRHDSRAAHYFREALRVYPLHLKSAIRLIVG